VKEQNSKENFKLRTFQNGQRVIAQVGGKLSMILRAT